MMWVSHQHNIQLQSKKRSDLNELIQVNAHFRIAVNHYDYRQIVTITDCQIANRSVPHIHYTCQHGIQRENLARNFYAFLKFCWSKQRNWWNHDLKEKFIENKNEIIFFFLKEKTLPSNQTIICIRKDMQFQAIVCRIHASNKTTSHLIIIINSLWVLIHCDLSHISIFMFD